MRVLLDSNILKSYLIADSEVIQSLEKFEKLLKGRDLELLVSRQIIDEYIRGCAETIYEEAEELEEKARALKLAVAPTEYGLFYLPKSEGVTEKSYASLQTKLKLYNESIEKYRADLIEHAKLLVTQFEKGELPADKIIRRILSSVKPKEVDEEILRKTEARRFKGNPPGKKNGHHGDAIIWETVLKYATDQDFWLVCYDSDFVYVNKNNKKDVRLNKLLQSEWDSVSQKKITPCLSLGSFINSFEKKNEIASKSIEKEESTALRSLLIGDAFNSTKTFITLSASPSLPGVIYNWEPLTTVASTKTITISETLQPGATILASTTTELPITLGKSIIIDGSKGKKFDLEKGIE